MTFLLFVFIKNRFNQARLIKALIAYLFADNQQASA